MKVSSTQQGVGRAHTGDRQLKLFWLERHKVEASCNSACLTGRTHWGEGLLTAAWQQQCGSLSYQEKDCPMMSFPLGSHS